jgi:hypothetical protein
VYPKWTAVVVLCSALVLSLALTASPEQQGTRTPGQPTEAHVWVDNRGREQAISVDLREANLDRPLRVQVVNDPAYGAAAPAPVRPARAMWDYETLPLAPASDLVARLNTQGALGWEVVGVVGPTAAPTLLLKRQR